MVICHCDLSIRIANTKMFYESSIVIFIKVNDTVVKRIQAFSCPVTMKSAL